MHLVELDAMAENRVIVPVTAHAAILANLTMSHKVVAFCAKWL